MHHKASDAVLPSSKVLANTVDPGVMSCILGYCLTWYRQYCMWLLWLDTGTGTGTGNTVPCHYQYKTNNTNTHISDLAVESYCISGSQDDQQHVRIQSTKPKQGW